MSFVPGWSPGHARRAADRLDASRRYCTVAPPTRAPRPAVSLSSRRLGYYVQGQAGTCWVHAPKVLFEVTARSRGYDAFPASRRAIGYAAKALYEGGGNPADGGSPTDALSVMAGAGPGIARESLCPYTDDRTQLAMPPPASVWADARRTHLAAPVKLDSVAEIIALIDAGFPVANGYQCPSTLQQGLTFVDSIGSTLGGHSQLIWGYMLPGVIDEHTWLELENWWGLVYPPLPASVAKLVDGYEPVRPDATSSAWIREDVYRQLCNLDGYAEHISATDVDGLARGVVVKCPGFIDAFAI